MYREYQTLQPSCPPMWLYKHQTGGVVTPSQNPSAVTKELLGSNSGPMEIDYEVHINEKMVGVNGTLGKTVTIPNLLPPTPTLPGLPSKPQAFQSRLQHKLGVTMQGKDRVQRKRAAKECGHSALACPKRNFPTLQISPDDIGITLGETWQTRVDTAEIFWLYLIFSLGWLPW
ncbi:hypothetical protein Bbelb_371780 [Branchiostoma belcheri]|nr:hypothetical protein Bbelb_371780 [Branchiostoma belcheri]